MFTVYDYLLTLSHLHFPAVLYFVSLFETQDRTGKAALALIVPVTQNFISIGQFKGMPVNLMYIVRMRYEN